MSYIVVGFNTDKSDWISGLILWLTRWKHSHVVLVSPDKTQIIEATHGHGVRQVPFVEWTKRDSSELRIIHHADPQGVWERAKSQVGKEYDSMYSWGWLFHRNWQDPAKWACSELLTWAAGLFSIDFDGTITARDIYLVTHRLPEPYLYENQD